jgi:hypothetical protein
VGSLGAGVFSTGGAEGAGVAGDSGGVGSGVDSIGFGVSGGAVGVGSTGGSVGVGSTGLGVSGGCVSGGRVGSGVGTVFQYGDSTVTPGVLVFCASKASIVRPMSVVAALVEISTERLHIDV